jgi:hypothetical protein
MKIIKGAFSALTVALMALTITACPPPEEDPAAFDGQDTIPTTGESPGEGTPPPGGQGGGGG